jgi:hypothetical protein
LGGVDKLGERCIGGIESECACTVDRDWDFDGSIEVWCESGFMSVCELGPEQDVILDLSKFLPPEFCAHFWNIHP